MSLTLEFNKLSQDLTFLFQNFSSYINLNDQFWLTIASISFNPIFWNIVARYEYKTHFLTKIVGSPKLGCYLLAITIFSLGIIRDSIYHNFLLNQPTFQPFLNSIIIKSLAIALFGFGNILVISSMWVLGVTGTYLGDYFGILMNERVTGFPFNINNNPMYNGSTLCFLATALWYGKPVGLVISAFVLIMYKIALLFEEPFTAKIYANRDAENAKKVE
ncbi:OPI3 [Candida pseudojiufengensis]|uniref:OPI3 n=1 Tax=Candida pseudojiufengensis TaxID=497109 RepID=UPI0022253DD6|nr:OPI3 [Candida pseudojiufengensis]KAI5965193.1 OPI3 [Candida pseudojiufengensis]